MIQLRVGESGSATPVVFLDLYEENLPKLTLSIEDITTTDATTTFSRQFRVPATTNNTEFFTTAFDVNGYDFDITQQQPATILIDGSQYKKGEIRLQKVYTNEVQAVTDYEIIFLGEIRDFISSIGEGKLCEVDLSEYNHTLTTEFVTGSWEAFPQNTFTDPNSGMFSGSIVYPLVDFGNTYDEDGDAEQTRISRTHPSSEGGSFTDSNHPLSIYRMRPCVRAKVIWDKIFESAGYTYTSGFLESNLFRQMYIGAWGDEAVVSLNAFGTANNATARSDAGSLFNAQVGTTAYHNMRFAFAEGDNGNNVDIDNNYYVVPTTGDYYMQWKWRLLHSWDWDQGQPVDGEVDVTFRTIAYDPADYVGTLTIIDSYDVTFSQPFANQYSDNNVLRNVDTTTAFPAGVPAGYVIQVQGLPTAETNWVASLYTSAESSIGSYLWIYDSEGETDVSSMMSCELLQKDFIKDIITKFRLVLAPDKNDPSNFIIEPWVSYIAQGDVFDWTEKLDTSKDVTLSPIFYTQKREIKFTDKKGNDFLNTFNEDTFDEVYGALDVVSPSPLLKDKREVKTNFVPLVSQQIELANGSNNGMFNCIVPQIHDHEVEDFDGTTKLLHNPVKPGVSLFFYDGLKSTGITAANNKDWYLWDESATPEAFSKFPMISQYSEWGTTADYTYGLDTLTVDLNWQRETGYIKGFLANYNLNTLTFQGPADSTPWANSVYDNYWAEYISTLYNKWSRRVTAYFILDADDLLNFSFDDVIYFRDAYYYVEKIYDVVVGEKSSVKVDLIKLNNFYPDSSGFVPLGEFWEGGNTNWNFETTNWENI